MNSNFLRIIIFALLATSFSSCIKDPVDPPIIIDPVYPVYETKWESVEIKSDLDMWKPAWTPVAGADTLHLFSNDPEKSRPRRGYYQYFSYYSRGSESSFGKEGLFIQSDTLLVFIDMKSSAFDPDTTAKVGYKIIGDTSLIVHDRSVTPSIQIKYKKLKLTEKDKLY